MYIGYQVSFPWVNRPERGVDYPSHLAPRLEKSKVCLRLCAFMVSYRVNFTLEVCMKRINEYQGGVGHFEACDTIFFFLSRVPALSMVILGTSITACNR
jgi:hypothetical protein